MSREPRSPRLYLSDILEAVQKINRFTEGMDQAAFEANDMANDAVLRNLEVIGEAASKLPQAIRDLAPEVEWRDLSDFRNHLAHGYFGLDDDVIWDAIRIELPLLTRAVDRLLRGFDRG